MERRFVCLNFVEGSISAYAAVDKQLKQQECLVAGPDAGMRDTEFDMSEIETFRLLPRLFRQQNYPALPYYPGGIDDIPTRN